MTDCRLGVRCFQCRLASTLIAADQLHTAAKALVACNSVSLPCLTLSTPKRRPFADVLFARPVLSHQALVQQAGLPKGSHTKALWLYRNDGTYPPLLFRPYPMKTTMAEYGFSKS